MKPLQNIPNDAFYMPPALAMTALEKYFLGATGTRANHGALTTARHWQQLGTCNSQALTMAWHWQLSGAGNGQVLTTARCW